MDQLGEIYKESVWMLPMATFFIGFMGSAHCVGMCGGLVLACTPKPANNVSYQLGRLASYSVLAVIAGAFGSLLSFDTKDPYLNLIPAILMGGVFIWIGLKSFFGKKIFQNSKMNSKIMQLWQKVLPKNPKEVSLKSSFVVGSFSILLPCGFLYGVLFALGAFQSPGIAFVCILAFWVGTLPVMGLAPTLIKKVLQPLQKKMPLLTSGFLIVIGVATIAHRVYMTFQMSGCADCH